MQDDRLPEPAELHAHLSRRYRLDWGDLPDRQSIVAEFGVNATERSLALLARAARVEPRVTADMLASMDGAMFPYHLENRLKSPQSLARKLKGNRRYARPAKEPEDVLRYTVGVDRPDQVVGAAERVVDILTARGWSTESAHHSYTEGSRYKGLHIFLRAHGELIEVQVHSRESIAVKEETTTAYEIERDHRQPQHLRDEMLTFAVGCSAELTQPAGIETLTNLGGVPVERRSYGRKRGTTPRASKELPPTTETERGQEPQERRRDDGRDGLAR